MSLGAAEVERLAALARLALAPAEAERLATELNTILEHVAALRAAELHVARPVSSMAEAAAGPRPDHAARAALAAAPTDLSADAEAGFFTVPRGEAREP